MLKKLCRFRRLALCLLLFCMVVVISNSPQHFVISKESANNFIWAFMKPVYNTINQTSWLFGDGITERHGISFIHNKTLLPSKPELTSAATNRAKVFQRSPNTSTEPKLSNLPANTKNDKTIKNGNTVMYVGKPFERFMLNLTNNKYYDPYIKAVMYTNASCQNANTYDAVIAVHSSPGNVQKRQMLRWLYTDPKQTHPYRFKVLFFIGVVNDSLTQSKLVQEGKQYGDVVQGSFIDSYRNLTYKAVFVYNWLSRHCKGLKLLLRLDDDVFVDVHYFFSVWRSRVGNKTNTIMCDYVFDDVVRRRGKWMTRVKEIPETHYNFRHCMGYFAALTSDLVPKIDEVGRRTLFFWIDDIFVYGFLAKKIGADFINVYRETSRGKDQRYEACLKTQGYKCHLMVFVTHRIEKFPQFYSLIHNNTRHELKTLTHYRR